MKQYEVTHSMRLPGRPVGHVSLDFSGASALLPFCYFLRLYLPDENHRDAHNRGRRPDVPARSVYSEGSAGMVVERVPAGAVPEGHIRRQRSEKAHAERRAWPH